MMIKCDICDKELKNERALRSHFWRVHTPQGQALNPGIGYENGTRKGKSWGGMSFDEKFGDRAEEMKRERSERLKGKPGRPQSKKSKKLISEKMKKAHAEGRAHNIGSSRWNNEPSWPEKFFMRVIENEFDDKDYIYEHPFHRFSLDFLWKHKKKVIEIDGEQHERFEDQKQRDIEKDKLLVQEGYQILRIKWKDMFHNTQKKIKEAKIFIDG